MLRKVFDVHCHVFNARILRDMLFFAKTKSLAREKEDFFGHWKDWVREFISALFDSEKKHHQFIIQHLKSNFPKAEDYATVPLMMDIYFMHSDPLTIHGSMPTGTLYFGEMMKEQIRDLKILSSKGNCYPFFAVDPRRAGLIDKILNGEYITQTTGGFYGIKLYPRLGYHPMSGQLPKLYKYCARNNIPIITHCSDGGFPPWPTPHSSFGHPNNFKQALIDNPDLIIDFAHFGYGGDGWPEAIIELMRNFSNVYSDLSCYTDEKDLLNFKSKYWKNETVKQRTMYGSDYDVFYFTQLNFDLNSYIQTFKRNFTEDELNKMISINPNKFLFGE